MFISRKKVSSRKLLFDRYFFLGRQPSAWDVAFDRVVGFYLSNFSSHEIYWPTPMVKWRVHLKGLEKLTRTCPIIAYETEKASEPSYFMSACGKTPQLTLVAGAKFMGVSIFLVNYLFRYYLLDAQ